MYGLALIFLLITIVGVIGNTLVLLVIAVSRQLHDSTNMLIANLAIADLLFVMLCVPITAYSYVFSWQFSQKVCYITVTLQYVTCYVSVWSLALLAIDRFISIKNPAATKSLKRSRGVVYTCFALWVIVFLLNSFQMDGVGLLTFAIDNETTGQACVDSIAIATGTATVGHARTFYWGFNLGAYLLPLSLSTVFYFLLVSTLLQTRVQSKSSAKMKRHATKMVFIVISIFGLCWLPQNLRFFLRGYNYPAPTFWEMDNNDLLLLIQSSIQILAYANSCVNPILYSVLSERFRNNIQLAYYRWICCEKYAVHSRRSFMARSSLGSTANPSHMVHCTTQLTNHGSMAVSQRNSLGIASMCGDRHSPSLNGNGIGFPRSTSGEFLPVTPCSMLSVSTATAAANGNANGSTNASSNPLHTVIIFNFISPNDCGGGSGTPKKKHSSEVSICLESIELTDEEIGDELL